MAALILHHLGAQTEARRRIEWSVGDVVSLLRGSHRRLRAFLVDQGVAAHALLARVLWLQGFPDQAGRMAESALHQAEAADHAISRCHALAQAMCPVTLWTGDLPAAERCVAMLIEVASDNAFEGWIVRGKCFNGLLLLQRGETDEGSVRLATALQRLRSVGSMAEYPAFLAALANGRALAGEIDEARTAIDQAISRSEISGECWCAAELLRIRGEIRLLQDAPDATSAEDCPTSIAGCCTPSRCSVLGIARGNQLRSSAAEMAVGVRKRMGCSHGYMSVKLKALRLPTLRR